MGKRKSARKPQTRKGPPPLDTAFTCPFCSHDKAITCQIDRKSRVARLECKYCQADYDVLVTALAEPIDVYSMWLDACEAVNSRNTESTSTAAREDTRSSARRSVGDDDEEEDDDYDDDLHGASARGGIVDDDDEDEDDD